MGGVQVAMIVGLVAATPVASRTERAMKSRPTWVAASFCGGEWTAALPTQVTCGVSSTRTAAGLTQDEKCSTPGDEATEFTAQELLSGLRWRVLLPRVGLHPARERPSTCAWPTR